MAINNISFVLGQGNMGRTLAGSDYISGYLVLSDTTPSGFTNSVARQVFSVADAVSKGIKGDYSDETKATATLTAGATGSAGNVITIKVTEPGINSTTNVVTIASYTRQASDTTSNILGVSLVNAINASGTGYTAVGTTASFVVSAKPGMGTSLNSGTPIAITTTGTATATVTSQFTGGVASVLAPYYYYVSEYFRIQPNGILWVGFFPTSDTTLVSISTMQAQANGAIRQFMYNSAATSTSTMLSELDLLQAQGVIMFNNYTPASILYSPNFYAISDLSTLPNIRSKSDNYVSVVIGSDAGGLGAKLSLTTAKSITCIGAALGAVSKAKVDEDIAWVAKFNISNGTEDETVGFLNGNLWNTLYGTVKSLIVQLDNFGYIFLKKLNNIAGSYFNDSHCAISVTSDYAYIENNRTIDKVVRNAYLELAPLIASPIYFNADGTLSQISISAFEDSAKPSLDAMVSNGEISGYAISVDPTSPVQQTGVVIVSILIQGVGVARNITVNLSYSLTV